MFNKRILTIPIGLLAAMTIGCPNEDKRLVELAEKSVERQARQNEAMANLNKELVQGSKRLIEADAEARKDTIELQRQLQDQQAEVGKQRDELDTQRQSIAAERKRDSKLGATISAIGLLIAAGLPMAVALILLLKMRADEPTDTAVGELLIEELVSDSPKLLPAPMLSSGIANRPSLPSLPDTRLELDGPEDE